MLGYVAGLGYPISTHEIQFLIELQNTGQGSSSPIEQRILSLMPARDIRWGYCRKPGKYLRYYPASALAECQKAEEMAFEQKKPQYSLTLKI
jgi:hypothetical protein